MNFIDNMADEKASLQIKGVSKYFLEQRAKRVIRVFENFSLDISGEQLLVLVGPSGCGKTTLLKMLAGLVGADRGEIAVMGKPMQPYNPLAITIFQDYSLFPWLTALENVELPLETKTWREPDKNLRKEKALEALATVGLEDRLHSYPKELSGGMQQRVALARSVVVKPKILLMDEPFGALDAQTRAEMQVMLARLWLEKKNLVVFVTHDIEEALILAHKIVVLSGRPTRILGEIVIDAPHPRNSDFLFRESTEKLRNKILKLLYEH
jgi:NitT/TauT family transport system ATP-binding protein